MIARHIAPMYGVIPSDSASTIHKRAIHRHATASGLAKVAIERRENQPVADEADVTEHPPRHRRGQQEEAPAQQDEGRALRKEPTAKTEAEVRLKNEAKQRIEAESTGTDRTAAG